MLLAGLNPATSVPSLAATGLEKDRINESLAQSIVCTLLKRPAAPLPERAIWAKRNATFMRDLSEYEKLPGGF
ncbi:MAG: hypothetical protein IJU79_05470 [Desulfovibrionaceae bacterium]|nr:hypothetical protein [Desulfovibrionaceae bacterium]